MASLDFLPATTYVPAPSALVRGRPGPLNTIMEDEEESTRRPVAENGQEYRKNNVAELRSPLSDNFPTPRGYNFMLAPRLPTTPGSAPLSDHFPTPRGNHFMIAPRLPATPGSAPLSDHFPTPRGNHFMPAPFIPESPISDSGSEYSQTSSVPWTTRDSYTTQVTEFDDLYDVSSDEEDKGRRKSALHMASRDMCHSAISKRMSTGSITSRNSLPSLIIPGSSVKDWSKPMFKFNSPVPPTPPPKVPMSPAVLRYLSTQDVLSSSATPSLDGSLDSEALAAISAPPTPDLGNDDREEGNGWGGIQLQPMALATLRSLSGDDTYEQTEQVIEVPQMSPTREMQQSPPPAISAIRRHNSIVLSPDQQHSLNSLSMLEIPSPGGFFSSLSLSSGHTWHFDSVVQQGEVQPSSTTAEHFYKTPWICEIERIKEGSEISSEVSLINRPTLQQIDSDETITGSITPEPFSEEQIVATEILADYDDGYVRRLNDVGQEHIDRTSLWLTAQTTYLSTLINPPEERDDETALQKRDAEASEAIVKSPISPVTTADRKMVRFSEMVVTEKLITSETMVAIGAPLPSMLRQESAYYRGFLSFVTRSRQHDAFVHALPRFEALQARRVNFPEDHRNQLLGKHQLSVVPLSAKKRMSANVARGDALTFEDPVKLKADREHEASEQMSGAAWNVMASKMLNGGRLIAAPAAKQLARLSKVSLSNSNTSQQARILDLGGQSACDWAWHCAFEYPNTKVYTVVTKSVRQLSNANICGPRNHRQVVVDKLISLPFPDEHFDLISARSLYTILKVVSENGEDEYVACLKECMRILKPGGYLEFSLLDSDIVNAGPRGQAKSVEFGFSLKTRGYDPTPTKAWLGRLKTAGFHDIKRAWMFLPMGAPLPPAPAKRDTMGAEVKLELEAMVTGSTNAIANVTGLVASWAWEKWMLKLQMEMGSAEMDLVSDVAAIVEEGRKTSAGYRGLNGWARKPVA